MSGFKCFNMTKFLNRLFFFTSILLAASFCKGQNQLDFFNLDADQASQTELSEKLKEISGIALSAEGKLFAHDDERSVIYQIDPEDGHIIKKFYFGFFVKTADFEDIEIVGEDFYLITSNGILYKFKEGADGQRVDYEAIDTDLKKGNDVEGLCYDPLTDCLLLALKGHPGAGLDKDFKTVYSFHLSTRKRGSKPRFVMNRDEIKERSKENDFDPSGIARHPVSGDFYVIAASGNLMVQLDPKGAIQSIQRLSRKVHNQPEGIVFSKDGKKLYISDEGKKHGTLTVYTTNK
jgi:uncharacterized protein YjiK